MNLLVTSTKKTKNDIIKIINPEEFLKFYVKKDTLKDSLNFHLTKIKRQIPQLSKIYDFSLTRRGKKKRQMQEPAESAIICAQQNFDVDGGLNPVKT